MEDQENDFGRARALPAQLTRGTLDRFKLSTGQILVLDFSQVREDDGFFWGELKTLYAKHPGRIEFHVPDTALGRRLRVSILGRVSPTAIVHIIGS